MNRLIFPAQPLYDDDRDDDADVGTYDSASQIHAGWILWRAGSLIAEPKMILDAYRRDLGGCPRRIDLGELISADIASGG